MTSDDPASPGMPDKAGVVDFQIARRDRDPEVEAEKRPEQSLAALAADLAGTREALAAEISHLGARIDDHAAPLGQLDQRLSSAEAGKAQTDALVGALAGGLEALESRLVTIEGDLEKARRNFEEQLAGTVVRQGLPGIFLNTMPKSGSVYIMRTLARSLRSEFMEDQAAHGFFPNYFLIPDRLARIEAGDVVRHEHFDASPINMRVLLRSRLPMVLHLRDPRQAVLSWAFHTNDLLTNVPGAISGTIHTPPPGYETWEFPAQVDWHLGTHLVSLAQWLREWINQTGEGSVLRVLITRFEDMVADQPAFFRRILDFYGIAESDFVFRPAALTAANNFRLGSTDEWRSLFTDEQKARALEIVGADVLQHFGWEP